ncbi:MAG TPA: Glu-tRNA(Gln) amidotransferase subunit GatD [Methanofastidiosum sp.]|nr:Glu-tRNA(Gln) amidotransferase subunit GatD [Methanofastidiosum sp.]HPA48918.1 Glu-tRNA(Gln) amidotransferase subunit GatD [Methanofastidiosum sp.]HQK62510.1 Glu-tRNA(Gln) amidotransferase subunit GatD [Methanofastidiosum sp.]HQM94338.1 Glu-tRNA(Gln) amidotransferase subunit GatD [Methanofastidiosum sp.]HQQ48943.1 Glu-tRNA(Gln) amidotransferase subunit GatD [Methanofastidiosum sp.]
MEPEVGDEIVLVKGDVTYHGIVIPSPKKDSIIVKLSNGYNIGFRKDSVTISKIEKKQKPKIFSEVKFKKRADLPEISIISTGGTIASRVDYETGGVRWLMKPEEIFFMAPELSDITSFRNIVSPFQIASESMTFECYRILAKEAAKELNSGSQGVIITHGTDTLHYTSAALSFMLQNLSKPVCLIGAQRSPDRGSFDGSMNLICGSYIAGHSDIGESVIVMHGEMSDTYCNVLRGTKVRKMHSTRRDTFRPVNTSPLARVYMNGKIEKLSDYRPRNNDNEVFADVELEERTAIIKAYPNFNPDIINYYIDKGYKGLVVEASALGHVPTDTIDEKFSWIKSIKRAREEGIIIVFATQCLFGRVDPFVYSNGRIMEEMGVIYAEDMLPETAYLKLSWILGHTNEYFEVKRNMLDNMVGEINYRIKGDKSGF